MKTVVVGDLSGLQSFLFTLTPGEGGQAKRLRARSFFIQILAECCALKFLSALGWTRQALVFCGAAKFVLSADSSADRVALRDAAAEINRWLLAEVGGQLNFAWAARSGDESESVLWSGAMLDLQNTKLAAWGDVAQTNGAWSSSALVLSGVRLDTHNRPIVPSRDVFDDKEIGGSLPKQNWLEVGADPESGVFNILGYACRLHEEWPSSHAAKSLALFALGTAQPPPGSPLPAPRRLSRYIPTKGNDEPVTFQELADEQAKGDKLLGVLKMDVDSLGVALERVQKTDPTAVRALSEKLDRFFSEKLDQSKAADPDWQWIYTVFSGGDDLLVVGPCICVRCQGMPAI